MKKRQIPRITDLTLEKQISYNCKTKSYVMSCGRCNNSCSEKKRWFKSQNNIFLSLSLNFNFCGFCQRWICEDCFLVDDGSGGISICRDCAEKQGIKGYTSAEFMELVSRGD